MDSLPELQHLIGMWCDRREYRALARVLPAWLGNNGLTDGWVGLHDALKAAYGEHSLPAGERELLKELYVRVEIGLRNR